MLAQMVDVGCGIGGSSRHIARKYGCTARGLTLSPVQARRSAQPKVNCLPFGPQPPLRPRIR
jgi:cyclopropane fatty-acyl-phospholipid synthase-like methyltransferase